MEAGQRRRPRCAQKRGPTRREARRYVCSDIPGSRSTPEAIVYMYGKPDTTGGPAMESTDTWKPVHAGGLVQQSKEARTRGRPDDGKHDLLPGGWTLPEARSKLNGKPDRAGGPASACVCRAAGPCRRPCRMERGSPTKREAPGQTYPVIFVEAGLHRRPLEINLGNPISWDALPHPWTNTNEDQTLQEAL